MLLATHGLVALLWASPPTDGPEAPATEAPPIEAPAAEPAPASPPIAAEPAPLPTPQPIQPAPLPTPAVQPQPQPQPQPGYHPGPPQPSTGIGALVAGPLVVALGIPFSFLGNIAWRDNCGPTSTNNECADGTLASAGSHTLTGMAYATGITVTAIGGARRGRYDATRDPTRTGTGFVVGGAVLLPVSLIGMGMVRLFLWLPTPDCMNYACVEHLQNLSTITVGTLALTSSAGAGLLMYGSSFNRTRPSYPPVVVLPQAGFGYAGLSLTGRF